MNVSATLNVFRLLVTPSLCLSHATVSTFNDLPVPLSKAFLSFNDGQQPDIKAVVLDKDDCFAKPRENVIYKPYRERFQALREAYPGPRLLIVSNSAGTGDDPGGKEADLLEDATGVEVLRHSTKKPGCGSQILKHFRDRLDTGVTKPSQIAIVGDRISTDIMMANMNGFGGLWVKDGVVLEKSMLARLEGRFASLLGRYGMKAPRPWNDFKAQPYQRSD